MYELVDLEITATCISNLQLHSRRGQQNNACVICTIVHQWQMGNILKILQSFLLNAAPLMMLFNNVLIGFYIVMNLENYLGIV